MMTKALLSIVIVVFLIGGCSRPLRVLMKLDTEQKMQSRYVDERNESIELLFGDIQAGRLTPGTGQEEIVARYGEPVLRRPDPCVADVPCVFLYRNPVVFFGAKKAYLEFDDQGLLASADLQESDGQ